MLNTSSSRLFEAVWETRLFNQLNNEQVKELATLTSVRYVRKGTYFVREGQTIRHLFLIHKGRTKLFRYSASGKTITVGVISDREPLLLSTLFTQKPCWATAQALIDTTVLSVEKERIIPFIEKNASVAILIAGILSGQVARAYERLRDMVAETAEYRIYKTLRMLSERLGLTLLFTPKEIDALSGTTTETALRVFSRIKKQNIIHTSRGKITIVNPARLLSLTEDQTTALHQFFHP
ncbi:MAG: Crp/Fnr family transcriptional regulator [Dehalococcoidia bacterium]